MFILGQDLVCEAKSGIPRCVPRTPQAAGGFKTLQLTLSRLLQQLPRSNKPTIDVDGMIGPSTALAVQMIAARLAEGKYGMLSELASAQPEEAIPYIGQNAMEIAGVFEQIMESDPQALLAPGQLAEAPVDPMKMIKGMLTGPRIAAVSFAALGLTGIAVAAAVSDRRANGVSDRSSMLPDSDGSDDFDEDGLGDDAVDDDAVDDGGGGDAVLPEPPAHLQLLPPAHAA